MLRDCSGPRPGAKEADGEERCRLNQGMWEHRIEKIRGLVDVRWMQRLRQPNRPMILCDEKLCMIAMARSSCN